MDVATNAWQLVGQGSDAKLILQNTGNARIGFVFADSLPAVDDFDLAADGEIGVLLPGMDPMTFTGLDDDTVNLYVRALGSRKGQLFVYDPAA